MGVKCCLVRLYSDSTAVFILHGETPIEVVDHVECSREIRGHVGT